MVKRARIKLTSTDTGKLESVCDEIKGIAKKIGVKMVGPIPLPTKKLVVPTRRTPCGDGSNTWDRYEIHRDGDPLTQISSDNILSVKLGLF